MLCANLLIEPWIFFAQIACFYKDIILTACPACLPSQNQSLNIRHYFEFLVSRQVERAKMYHHIKFNQNR